TLPGGARADLPPGGAERVGYLCGRPRGGGGEGHGMMCCGLAAFLRRRASISVSRSPGMRRLVERTRSGGGIIPTSWAIFFLLMAAFPAPGQPVYRKAPPAIAAVLDAPPTPVVSVSPARDHLLLVQGVRYPPIADLAEPMLRLAGLRINPRTNGPHA